MDSDQLTWITGVIWGIADDVLRDPYLRGKYRDVILPMTVLRRFDAVLEPTKQAVLETKATLDRAGIVQQDQALRQAAGQAFYNTSKFTLRDLGARSNRQRLRSDFEAYLDGFSPNVQDILDNFRFRNQIPRLSRSDTLRTLIEKFLSPEVNLGPEPVLHGDGSVKHPGIDDESMTLLFRKLVTRFDQESPEDAGEHRTPEDVAKLMAKLIFKPIADEIASGTYLLYDGACGTGGMLTVAEETLQELATEHGKQVATHLYGQEINAETYAICKADLLLKGEGDAADNIIGGPEHSTLANDAFAAREFDFMLSNPPYGKSWESDLTRMGGKKEMKDPRFVIEHAGDPEYSLVTRSSDGQMLFLANMLSKMKAESPLGSRIAEVHNGSSLFTGDAGQGESNIRRWIIESDWLEAIVALPLNMFYNTGIATYIWVLSNRKPAHRRGRVQLIDATGWSRPLRKNLGKKNCELADEDIERICDTFLVFEETEHSKIFPNEAFGYWKVVVERPLRLAGIDGERSYAAKEIKELKEAHERDDDAPPVIKKIHRKGVAANPLHGLFPVIVGGETRVVEYEPDQDLRIMEQVTLTEEGGIDAFLRREMLPYAPDAWYDQKKVEIGYEMNTPQYFATQERLQQLAGASGWTGYPARKVFVEQERLTTCKSGKLKHGATSLYLTLLGEQRAFLTREELPKSRLLRSLHLQVDPEYADPRFIVSWFNSSEIGRITLKQLQTGEALATINPRDLLKATFYLPKQDRQVKMAEGTSRLNEIRTTAEELQTALWAARSDVPLILSEIDHIGISRDPKRWIETLPYPLATILWRYYAIAGKSAKEEQEILLAFFEASAAFLATIHLSAFLEDSSLWAEHGPKLQSQLAAQSMSFRRLTFGSWKLIYEFLSARAQKLENSASQKDVLARIYATQNRSVREFLMNSELRGILQLANRRRNTDFGHSGARTDENVEPSRDELLRQVHRLREIFGRTWLRYELVQPLESRYSNGIHRHRARRLMGIRDKPFEHIEIPSAQALDIESLYLFDTTDGTGLRLQPLILVMPSPERKIPACYFYSRQARNSIEFVSYHLEQEPTIEGDFSETGKLLKALNTTPESTD